MTGLTEGDLFRGLITIAAPIVVGNVLQSGLELVDLFFVGRLGSEAIAGVAMGSSVIMVLMTVIVGIVTHTVEQTDYEECPEGAGEEWDDFDFRCNYRLKREDDMDAPISPAEVEAHREGHLADIADADFDRLQTMAEQVDKLLNQLLPQAGKLVLDIGLVNDLALESRAVLREVNG